MHFLITPRRSRGVTLQMVPAKRTTAIRGNLVVANRVCQALNRHSVVASLQPVYGVGPLLLPEIFDAMLSAMTTLSGIEFDGERWYAQSWWCRPIQ
jgi:hypothetical protein